MFLEKIIAQINIPSQCKKLGLPLWQCPSFLFLVMGAVIIGSSLITFFIGNRYIDNPETVTLIVLLLTIVLFIVDFTIVRSFERLAEANRMKSEFINIVSHQLRSPLSNLKWAIDLLISGRLGKIEEKQIEYFKILKENSARMENLVSDLLIVSRIETATLIFRKEEFFLGDLIKGLISEFTPFATASNVTIKFEPESDLPKIIVDPKQIRQVVEIFLDNAVRYNRVQGVVEIKLARKNKNVCCEIEDNGVGIPKEDQKYIFQKFFRSENIMRRQTQGSGLGLYIAKSIIEESGGEIGFKSEENKGSTFWFTLPIK